MRSLLLLALLAAAVTATTVQFNSHRVLRLEMRTEEQLRLVTELVYSNTTRELGLDWWDEPRHIGDFADVRVPPPVSRQAEEIFASYGLTWRVMIEDVQAIIDQQTLESRNNTNADWFSDYHTYDDTVAWVTALVSQYSSIATLEVIGQSYEGRNIYAVHVNGKGARATKPAIFYDGGIHAREWISPATVQYILYQLVSQYGVDPTITTYVDGISWTIVPIFNVDGYVYTWTKDRMWRKTRTPNSGSSCVGTDPCRNAPAGFGGSGSSSNPCDDTYHGPYALSDPSVKTVTDALAKTANLKAYINFHSYSQLFLSPWGYTTKYPPTTDYNAQTALGNAFVAAIKAKHGKVYEEGPVATTIYMASGIINDYTYDDLKVLYSYACELRDTGTYGFLLPASQIVPTGEEIFAGVLVMAQTVIKL